MIPSFFADSLSALRTCSGSEDIVATNTHLFINIYFQTCTFTYSRETEDSFVSYNM